MFGKAVKKALEPLLTGIQEGRFNDAAAETTATVLARIDDDNVLEELGDDLARGFLDRRYIVSEPTTIEIEIFMFKIKINIKALKFNLRKRRRVQDALDLHDPEGKLPE